MDDCNILYIDRSLLYENKPGDWLHINFNRLCGPHPDGYYRVNMDSFKIPGSDRYSPELMEWLIGNEDWISFQKSEEFIRCQHSITGNSRNDVLKLPVLEEMSPNEFINRINSMSIPDVQDNFNSIRYKYHVALFEDKNHLGICLMRFKEDSNCFSFPLLRIIAMESIGGSLVFKIKKGVGTETDTIILTIKIGNNYTAYYNFSHIPPFAPI